MSHNVDNLLGLFYFVMALMFGFAVGNDVAGWALFVVAIVYFKSSDIKKQIGES
jgi:hypothetical protein